MMVAKRNLLSKGLLFRFHVKLQGCFRVFDWHSKLLCRQNVQWVPIALQALDWRRKTSLQDGAVCYEHLPIIQVTTIVAIRCFTILSTCKCQFCGSEMQKATIEASHAALPPKKAGDTRDAITIPSAKGTNVQVSFVFFSFVVERKLFTASARASAMLPRPQRLLPRHTFHI